VALSATKMLGTFATIPLGTYYIVINAKAGVKPWKGWAYTHSHYSHVIQVPSIVWKKDSGFLETYRWSLVASAFVFFAFFGFADAVRQHYRRLYSSIASLIGYSTSTQRGSSDGSVVHSPYWPV
jgi:pheromone a factor receptor